MGKRLAYVIAALFAAVALAFGLSLPAFAEEIEPTFVVEASSFELGNVDEWTATEDGHVFVYEGVAALDEETKADVELRFSNVEFDEDGGFVSADVELVVVDAPEDALVTLVLPEPSEEADIESVEEPVDVPEEEPEEPEFIGPASGFELRLELVEDELVWSVPEEEDEPGVEPEPEAGEPTEPEPVVDPEIDPEPEPQPQPQPQPQPTPAPTQDYSYPEYSDYDFEDYELWDDEPEVIYHTVTFKDPDGRILDVQEVEHGGAATAPRIPRRVDETFLYWDRDFSYVTEDIVVRAVYSGSVPLTGDATVSAAALLTLLAVGAMALWCARNVED